MGIIKIKFLGTAAAEGWPGLFCECDACQKARKVAGKNIRTRSSALIEEKYLIDFPADTYHHVLKNDMKLSKIEYLLVTHAHQDHFYPEDLILRNKPFAHIEKKKILNVFGNQKVEEKLFGTLKKKESINFNLLKHNKKFIMDQIEVTSLSADHGGEEKCFVFIIDMEGTTLFYGHDSGYYPEKTWDIIEQEKFDCVILDCTGGPLEIEKNHMGITTNVKVKERLIKFGAANNDTRFILTHFSHNGGLLHNELEKKTKKYDFEIAYDGLQIDF